MEQPHAAPPPPSDGSAAAEPFARYLARIVATQGYAPGLPPEARELADASDFALTKAGLSPALLCIVDAETNPARRFQLDNERLIAIAKACRAQYSGTVNGVKMPVSIELVEVRKAATGADAERLAPLRKSVGGVVIGAYLVDLATSAVTRSRRSLFDPRRRQLERALREPRLTPEQSAALAAAPLPAARWPWLTCALLAVLAAVFAAELLFPVEPAKLASPHIDTLIAMGALNRRLALESGEWYRLLSSSLLHGGPLHLVLNGVALWMAGSVLERLLGRARLGALFVLGALGGSLGSMAINDPATVSVGASGAIMGMLAAAVVSSFRLPTSAARDRLQVGLLQVLVPSLIPLATVRTGGRIDFAGHLGGAAAGACAGALLLATWARSSPRPRFAGAAAAIALAGVALFAWSGLQAAVRYPRYAVLGQLIPRDQLPRTDADVISRASALVERYPRDPRARLYRAVAYLDAKDARSAEAQLRAALQERELLEVHFSRELEVIIRSVLARSLLAQGRAAEAREAAKPACRSGPDGATPEQLRPLGVCDR